MFKEEKETPKLNESQNFTFLPQEEHSRFLNNFINSINSLKNAISSQDINSILTSLQLIKTHIQSSIPISQKFFLDIEFVQTILLVFQFNSINIHLETAYILSKFLFRFSGFASFISNDFALIFTNIYQQTQNPIIVCLFTNISYENNHFPLHDFIQVYYNLLENRPLSLVDLSFISQYLCNSLLDNNIPTSCPSFLKILIEVAEQGPENPLASKAICSIYRFVETRSISSLNILIENGILNRISLLFISNEKEFLYSLLCLIDQILIQDRLRCVKSSPLKIENYKDLIEFIFYDIHTQKEEQTIVTLFNFNNIIDLLQNEDSDIRREVLHIIFLYICLDYPSATYLLCETNFLNYLEDLKKEGNYSVQRYLIYIIGLAIIVMDKDHYTKLDWRFILEFLVRSLDGGSDFDILSLFQNLIFFLFYKQQLVPNYNFPTISEILFDLSIDTYLEQFLNNPFITEDQQNIIEYINQCLTPKS